MRKDTCKSQQRKANARIYYVTNKANLGSLMFYLFTKSWSQSNQITSIVSLTSRVYEIGWWFINKQKVILQYLEMKLVLHSNPSQIVNLEVE